MDDAIQEYFGDVISVYTRDQAMEDGFLMKNPSDIFDECDVITTNLWAYIEEKNLMTDEILYEEEVRCEDIKISLSEPLGYGGD